MKSNIVLAWGVMNSEKEIYGLYRTREMARKLRREINGRPWGSYWNVVRVRAEIVR